MSRTRAPPPETAMVQVRAWIGQAPWAALAELACRAGYLARGFIYFSVGTMALLAAADVTPEAEGSMGALEAWSRWPFGVVLLVLTGLGLYGFAGWRVLQSVFDADQQGRSLRAIGARAGQAISGLIYGALAISVFGLVNALGDMREADDQAQARRSVEAVLALPGGELLIAGAGLFVLGAGVGNVIQVFGRDFCKPLACDASVRAWAPWLGRAGYLGRGLAFLPVGGLMLLAGAKARGEDAPSMGGALQLIEAQPFGDALLALVALGLVAFGLFAFIEARYREMAVAKVVG